MTLHFEQHDIASPLHGDVSAAYFLPLEAAANDSRSRNQTLKRLFDIIISVLLLLAFAPVMVFVAAAIKVDGGPALFSHRRVGRQNQAFGCLKFRSMSVAAEQDLAVYLAANPQAAAEWAAQRKLQNDPRVTRLGKFLRATSIDELPQLFNVVRGEMSLIGPRPVVPQELDEHYGIAGRRAYTAMPPGITGLWQVSGRSDTSYAERVSLDITYVNDWSLQQDFKIMLRTIPAVLRRKGAV
jgi:lipopolysaccharide/colanic/teichoic acid biosynthesis glycosyltransferase